KTLGTYREAPAGGATGNAPRGKSGPNPDALNKQQNTAKPEEAPVILPIKQLLAATDGVLPYKGDYTISLSDRGPVTVRKNKVGFFAPAASDEVKLNATTAKVEEISVFREKPLNERIGGSIKALHVGNVYGQFTKLLYFLACLVATSLPITGTMIWLNKMKKKPAKRNIRRGQKAIFQTSG
ncbi:MAG TPA: PepSY-associated TM helix domain-containing protein, partial [Parapedobacter sp.]|nr:PepSY-associated TM helix domain-containing protein [Parapedobacter sp.]